MKNILKQILYFLSMPLIKFTYLFWSYSTFNKLKKIKRKLHSLWISNEFSSFGKDSTIGYPIVLRGGKYITLGSNISLGERGVLTAWDSYMDESFAPRIIIGDNTSIGEDFHITAIDRVVIGNNVLMGKKITITDNSHGKVDINSLAIAPGRRRLFSKGPVTIKDGVWIGEKATILPGVTIGINSIIGANAVVISDIPDNCVAAGVPAKVVRIIIT
jgi:acetyltransferase-like isoleucine patch superfamily enzyme